MEIAELRRNTRKRDNRTIYILETENGKWRRIPLHAVIKKLAKKYKLGWLRVRTSKKRHINIDEMLVADISSKLMD